MILLKISTFWLIALYGLVCPESVRSQSDNTGMRFSLLDRKSRDFSPSIMVTFPDGHYDNIKLEKHFFNDNDRMAYEHDCRYFGYLENERDACVAMTGCLGSEDILLTIMSSHAPGSTRFLWTKEGDVEILDADKLGSTQNPDFENLQESVPTNLQNPYLDTRAIEDDVCYYLKPPATAQLNIKVAFTEFVYDDADRNFTLAEINAKRAMAHVQTAFCHPSLGMKVHINVQEVIYLEGITQPYKTHNSDMQKLMFGLTESLIEADNTTHIIVYVMEGSGGGEAPSDSPCQSNPGSKHILNSGKLKNIYNVLSLAFVVTHELGHAMGMMHPRDSQYDGIWDCNNDNKNQLMDFPAWKTEWSPCNAMDVRRMYTRYYDTWCMPEYPSACSADDEDGSLSFFQILGSDGTALEELSESDCVPTYTTNLTNSCGPTFTLNEFKDSQFWYLDMVPGSDYGRIGPKKYSLRYSWAGTSTCLTVDDCKDQLMDGKDADSVTNPCVDKVSKGHCQEFYDVNDLENYKVTRRNCAKSCGVCAGDSNVKYSKIQVEVQGECKDQSNQCPYWASIGLCGSNHGYMINGGNCLKSCGVCAGDFNVDHQMWKKEGMHLMSKYKGAILGVHKTVGLSAFLEENENITIASIDEEATTSFELTVPYCDNEEIIPAPNGIFEIKDVITGAYLSSSASSGEVFVSNSSLGCDSQWSLEPETDSNGIWGHIKAMANKKYLVIGNEGQGEIILVDNIGMADKSLWRRVGDQFVSKLGIRRGWSRRTPYIINKESDGNGVSVIRASASQWKLSEITDTDEIPCPCNWKLDAKSGRCYFFAEDVKVNWTEAVKYCKEQGGFLSDIPNQETQDLLVDLNPYKDSEYMAFYSRWWIGANNIYKTSELDLENAGKNCWDGCNKIQGKCDWCGSDGLCCRKNHEGNECDGTIGGEDKHECLLLNPGKFTWINSGHDVEYEAWNSGQPNFSGDCVHFRYFFWKKQAYWEDVSCSEINRPICATTSANPIVPTTVPTTIPTTGLPWEPTTVPTTVPTTAPTTIPTTTAKETACPMDNPFAYLNGKYCCETNQERVNGGYPNEVASGTCDGKGFSIESTCCKGNKYLKCPHAQCKDYAGAEIHCDLVNAGKNCWSGCNEQQGKCEWCGTDGYCCRKDRVGNGCDGLFGGEDLHACVLLPEADCPDIDVIEQNACEDKWSEEKCKEKTTNGEDEEKCRKNNIKKNCQKTCGHCQ